MDQINMLLPIRSLIDGDSEHLEQLKIIIRNVIKKYHLLEEMQKFEEMKKFLKIKKIKEMKKFNNFAIDLEKLILAGVTVKNAHAIYSKESVFDAMETPLALPHQLGNVICPENIILTSIRFIKRERPNDRGVYYNFEGYILYLLIDTQKQTIWDARGEITDP